MCCRTSRSLLATFSSRRSKPAHACALNTAFFFSGEQAVTSMQKGPLRRRALPRLRHPHHLQGVQQGPGEGLRAGGSVAPRGEALRGLALTLAANGRPDDGAVDGAMLAT